MKTRPCHYCHGTGKEIDPVAFGLEMRKLRLKAGISLRDLAKAMQLSPPYVSDLERGNRGWNAEMAERYCEALKRAKWMGKS